MTELTQMWDALARYQPYADKDGHGETWQEMCEQRTERATIKAAEWGAVNKACAVTAERAAWDAFYALQYSGRAIKHIEAAIEERT